MVGLPASLARPGDALKEQIPSQTVEVMQDCKTVKQMLHVAVDWAISLAKIRNADMGVEMRPPIAKSLRPTSLRA